MNQTTISLLQQQFPLSKKKFLKKTLEKSISAFFLGFLLSALFSAIYISITIGKNLNLAFLIVVALVLLIAGFLIVILPYMIYVREYIKRYYYSADDNFLTIKKGVFAPAEIHVQWQKIQDVYVDQDILDRILGLCDVHIASATVSSGIAAHIDGVDANIANGLKDYLLNKVVGVSRNNTQQSQTNEGSTATANIQPTNNIQVNLAEEISSEKYPLTNKWLVVSILEILVGALTFVFILSISIFTRDGNSSIAGILIFAAVVALVLFARIIGLFLYKKNYKFVFQKDNIYYRTGILSLSEKHMPYSTIQDVTVKQDFIEKIFGIAEVRIENAVNTPVVLNSNNQQFSSGVVIQGISKNDAEGITNILRNNVLSKLDSRHGL